jgi:phage shock protein C
MQMNRRLYRCRENRVLAGVASGVAEFFQLDPTLVRVVWFVSFFAGGFSLLVYIGLAIIVPLEPLSDAGAVGMAGAAATSGAEGVAGDAATAPEGHRHAPRAQGRLTMFLGIALVLLGSLALLDVLLPSVSWRYLWPVFIVGMGTVLIAAALRREPTQP